MSGSSRLVIFISAALAVVALTGCSEATKREAKREFEAGKREAVMELVGEPAVEQAADVTLSSGLSCRSASGGGSISCAGTTRDGRPVTLTGVIVEVAGFVDSNWVKGDFLATVDGRNHPLPTCLGVC